jgi:hypothetical protein
MKKVFQHLWTVLANEIKLRIPNDCSIRYAQIAAMEIIGNRLSKDDHLSLLENNEFKYAMAEILDIFIKDPSRYQLLPHQVAYETLEKLLPVITDALPLLEQRKRFSRYIEANI